MPFDTTLSFFQVPEDEYMVESILSMRKGSKEDLLDGWSGIRIRWIDCRCIKALNHQPQRFNQIKNSVTKFH